MPGFDEVTSQPRWAKLDNFQRKEVMDDYYQKRVVPQIKEKNLTESQIQEVQTDFYKKYKQYLPSTADNIWKTTTNELGDFSQGFTESLTGKAIKANPTQGSGIGKTVGEFTGPIAGTLGAASTGAALGSVIPGIGTVAGGLAGGVGYGLGRGFNESINRQQESGKTNPNVWQAAGQGLLEGGLNAVIPGVGGSVGKRIATNVGLGAVSGGLSSAIDEVAGGNVNPTNIAINTAAGGLTGGLLGEGFHGLTAGVKKSVNLPENLPTPETPITNAENLPTPETNWWTPPSTTRNKRRELINQRRELIDNQPQTPIDDIASYYNRPVDNTPIESWQQQFESLPQGFQEYITKPSQQQPQPQQQPAVTLPPELPPKGDILYNTGNQGMPSWEQQDADWRSKGSLVELGTGQLPTSQELIKQVDPTGNVKFDTTKVDDIINRFNNETDLIKREGLLQDLKEKLSTDSTLQKINKGYDSLVTRGMLSGEGRPIDILSTLFKQGDLLFDALTGDPYTNLSGITNVVKDIPRSVSNVWKRSMIEGVGSNQSSLYNLGEPSTRSKNLITKTQDFIIGGLDSILRDSHRRNIIDVELKQRGLPTTRENPNVQVPKEVFQIADRIEKEKLWGLDTWATDTLKEFNQTLEKNVPFIPEVTRKTFTRFGDMTIRVTANVADYFGYGFSKELGRMLGKSLGIQHQSFENANFRKVIKQGMKAVVGNVILDNLGVEGLKNGLITPSYDEKNKDLMESLKQQGIQPGSINVSGYWIPTRTFGPFGPRIQIAVDREYARQQGLKQNQESDWKTDMDAMIHSLTKNIINQNPVLKTIFGERTELNIDTAIRAAIQSTGISAITQPGIARSILSYMNSPQTESRSGDPVEAIMNSIIGIYRPETQQVGLDGQPIPRPSVFKQIPENELLNELTRLNNVTGITGIMPGSEFNPRNFSSGYKTDENGNVMINPATGKPLENNINVTSEKATEYLNSVKQQTGKLYSSVMQSPEYQQLNDVDKAELLKDINNAVEYKNIIQSFPDATPTKNKLGITLMQLEASGDEGMTDRFLQILIQKQQRGELQERLRDRRQQQLERFYQTYRQPDETIEDN